MSRWFIVCKGVRQGGALLIKLRASHLVCYLFDMFMGSIMYTDDIILLSDSLNDLQSVLRVRENVSSQLLLKVNTNKCKCVALGKMARNLMSRDGLRLDNGAVM